MSAYAIRVWNNGDEIDRGSMGEHEMVTEWTDIGEANHEYPSTVEDIQLRLLEAINCNLASIAESLDKLRARAGV